MDLNISCRIRRTAWAVQATQAGWLSRMARHAKQAPSRPGSCLLGQATRSGKMRSASRTVGHVRALEAWISMDP